MPYPMTRQYFDDYVVGQTFETHGRTLTETDLVNFCGLIGDYEPPHADETFARKSPVGRRVIGLPCDYGSRGPDDSQWIVRRDGDHAVGFVMGVSRARVHRRYRADASRSQRGAKVEQG
jgi:hypothetical protein